MIKHIKDIHRFSMWFIFDNSYLTMLIVWYSYVKFSGAKTFNESNIPVIIWWTDLLFPHLGKEAEISCTYGKCLSSTKHYYKNEYRYVTYLFYGTDFEPENLPLPRRNNHFWALLHEESPMNNYMLSHIPGISLFNFTSTFSRYSDHPLTTQFIPSSNYFTERKSISIAEKNKLRKQGLAPVLYLQSHCNVASDRDSYVQSLMNYVNIDSYGACLHNKDMPDHLSSTSTFNDDSLFSFISNYKFHIAFENALCDDYITEKLYRALYVGSVPIYKGSPSVNDWVPHNNSVIMVDKFSSPEELGKFISHLDENDHLYSAFLEFKETGLANHMLSKALLNREWGVNDIEKVDFIRSFECNVCDKMYSMQNSSQSYVANLKHMHCPQPHPSFVHEIDPVWQKEEWIENYWFSYDKAKAIQMMLQNNDKDTSNFMKYIYKLKYPNS